MNDKNNDAQLQRWWDGLTPKQRKAAIRAADTGDLPAELQASLRKAGLSGTKSGSAKMSKDTERFLKMRHDA